MIDEKAELLAKLAQIQEQAQLTLDEFPVRLARERLRLIIGLARYLSTALDMSWAETTIPDARAKSAKSVTL